MILGGKFDDGISNGEQLKHWSFSNTTNPCLANLRLAEVGERTGVVGAMGEGLDGVPAEPGHRHHPRARPQEAQAERGKLHHDVFCIMYLAPTPRISNSEYEPRQREPTTLHNPK